MTISNPTALKNVFTQYATVKQTMMEDLIDTSMREPLIAIASAAEGGKIGIVRVVGTASASLESAGAFGLLFLATQTTAAAEAMLPGRPISDGSASVPAISFTSDTDTGFYLERGNTIGLALQGATAAQFGTAAVSFYGPLNEAKANSVAAGTSIWVTDGNLVHITGTGEVSAFGTPPHIGAERTVIIDSSVKIHHNATLDLPSQATVQGSAGDAFIVRADSATKSVVTHYQRANGRALVETSVTFTDGLVLITSTAVTNTSVMTLNDGIGGLTGYNTYYLVGSGLRVQSISFDFSYNSGATFNNDYNVGWHGGYFSTTTFVTGNSDSLAADLQLVRSFPTDISGGTSWSFISVLNNFGAGFNPRWEMSSFGVAHSVTNNTGTYFNSSGIHTTAASPNAIKILGFNNFAVSGTISLYGVNS